MTDEQVASYIGKKATYEIKPGCYIQGKITTAKFIFGRLDLTFIPDNVSGKFTISADNLKIIGENSNAKN